MPAFLKSLLCVFALMAVLTGCENTIHGIGKDMQQNGEKIQKSD
jgi:predicted small secreted protein